MKDQAVWEQAVASASEWYVGQPPAIRIELDVLLEDIIRLKQELVGLATSAGSAEVCRACGGECCLLGKYHVSVLDILAYRKAGVDPPAPGFDNSPACPYSDASGCLMQPCFRPATCVIFNCQQVEDRLPPAGREQFQACENMLRDTITRAGRISGTRLDRPLLLSCS